MNTIANSIAYTPRWLRGEGSARFILMAWLGLRVGCDAARAAGAYLVLALPVDALTVEFMRSGIGNSKLFR
ncbi:hypothetical protein D3C85_1814530 [compost metagenome]